MLVTIVLVLFVPVVFHDYGGVGADGVGFYKLMTWCDRLDRLVSG